MSKSQRDGRLTVRFNELLPSILDAAASADMEPSRWVRRQIRLALSRRTRRQQKRAVA